MKPVKDYYVGEAIKSMQTFTELLEDSNLRCLSSFLDNANITHFPSCSIEVALPTLVNRRVNHAGNKVSWLQSSIDMDEKRSYNCYISIGY